MRTIALLASSLLIVSACGSVEEEPLDGNPQPTQHTLSVTASGTGTGTITSSPAGIDCGATCTMQVDEGDVVMLTATPGEGSVFASWMGGGCSGTGPCAVTVGSDVTITARFVEQRTVTVIKAGNGTGAVTSTPAGIDCGADCSESVDPGAMLTLAAAATNGSTFLGWSGGGCSGDAGCTVTASTDVTVTATFGLNNSLSVTTMGNGMGRVTSNPAGIDCGSDCSEVYAPSTMVTLSASAIDDSTYEWGGACTGSGACQVTVDQARNVTITWTKRKYDLRVTLAGAGAGKVTSNVGGIDCSPTCMVQYDSGTSVQLTAMQATGSSFGGWSGACTGTGACTVLVDQMRNVTATFDLTHHQLTVQKTGNAAANGIVKTRTPSVGIDCGIDCSETYDYNTMVTLETTVPVGTEFKGWSGGGCTGMGLCTTTITAATTVMADFALTRHTVTVTKNGTGAGTVTATGINCGADCAEMYDYGSQVTLTATPALPGSAFAGWTGGGCGNVNPCVTSAITGDVGITAKFDAVIYSTWDPVFSPPGTIAYSNGNLSVAGMGALSSKNARSMIGKSSGKWYWEVLVTAGSTTINDGGIGVMEARTPNVGYLGSFESAMSFGYGGGANLLYYSTWTGATVSGIPPAGAVVAAGVRYMFALDMDTKRLWVGHNGTWHNGGNPATNVNPTMSGLSGTVFAGLTFYNSNANAWTANFGASAFTYGVPAGFNAGLYSVPTTWDPTFSPAATITYSNGNVSISSASSTSKNARGSLGVSSGKWYWEVRATNGASNVNAGGLGIMDANHPNKDAYLGSAPRGMSFGYGNGFNVQYYMDWAGASVVGTPPPNTEVATNRVYQFALDLATGRLWVGMNGAWFGGGDPAAGTNPVMTGLSGPIFPGVTFYADSINAFTANFTGVAPFSFARPQGFAPLL